MGPAVAGGLRVVPRAAAGGASACASVGDSGWVTPVCKEVSESRWKTAAHTLRAAAAAVTTLARRCVAAFCVPAAGTPFGRFCMKLWQMWWLVCLAWVACSLIATDAVKRASAKEKITTITAHANLVVGWASVAPLAFYQGLDHLRHCGRVRHVLAIAMLTALEKYLTNLALYCIGASLKTALHTINVALTLIAAAVLGVDMEARACIFQCKFGGKFLLTLSVILVVGGGVITGFCAPDHHEWNTYMKGVLLQLGSGVTFAVKTVTTKMLLGGPDEDDYYTDRARRPTPLQIAFVTEPVMGFFMLAAALWTEDRSMKGCWDLALVIGVTVTGMLVFSLQLTRLTSPLTVAILGVLKNIVGVVFFLTVRGESFTKAQERGFIVSVLGCLAYACAVRGRRQELIISGSRYPSGFFDSSNGGSIGSEVEQQGMSFHADPLWGADLLVARPDASRAGGALGSWSVGSDHSEGSMHSAHSASGVWDAQVGLCPRSESGFAAELAQVQAAAAAASSGGGTRVT